MKHLMLLLWFVMILLWLNNTPRMNVISIRLFVVLALLVSCLLTFVRLNMATLLKRLITIPLLMPFVLLMRLLCSFLLMFALALTMMRVRLLILCLMTQIVPRLKSSA